MAIVAALAASLVIPASAFGSGLKAIWGPLNLPNGSSAFPTYQELGVDVFEYQVTWSSVAPTEPTAPANPADPAYNWPSALDTAIAQAAAHGMEVALLVKGTPWWAVNGATQGQDVRTQAPSNSQDYANFLRAASARYPTVRRWMIWGEANRTAVWSSGPVAYADLLDAAYGALKPLPGDPDTVIGGMTFTYGETPPFDWANQMVRTGGQRPRLDEFGHNPFTRRCPDLANGPNYLREGARDISDVDTFIGELRAAFGPGVKLWLSELTISSDRANRAFTFYVTRQEQADWLSKAFRIAGSVDYVSGLGWFNLHDESAAIGDGLTTGLMTYEGEHKPAFDAYKNARLDGSQPLQSCTASAPPGGGSPPPDRTPPSFTLKLPRGKLSLRKLRRSGYRFKVSCKEACRLSAAFLMDRKTARRLKLGRKAVSVGKARASLSKAGTAKLKLKLSRKAARRTGRLKKLKLTLEVSATDAAGNRSRQRRVLRLRR